MPGIDLSSNRFHPLWMVVGCLIGRGLGLILGMNLGFWYFADPVAVALWQVLGAFSGALFFSFMMTSEAPPQTKGAVLGMGTGFFLAATSGEVWAAVQHRESAGLESMTVAEGIFFEWAMMHASWLGLFVGWAVGAATARRNKKNLRQKASEEET